jgi:hypothetical protein
MYTPSGGENCLLGMYGNTFGLGLCLFVQTLGLHCHPVYPSWGWYTRT